MDNKCKHTGEYCELTPGLETNDEYLLKPKTKAGLKSLIQSAAKIEKKKYHELSIEQKRMMTDQWDKYNPNACDQMCSAMFERDPWEN